MPELPEVETIRRDLAPLVVGRTIREVDVDADTLPRLAGIPLDLLRANLVGRTVRGTGRRGKYLMFTLDDGHTFVCHLRMTGRLVWRAHEAPTEPFQRALIAFDDGHDLRWSDMRKFGTWRLAQSPDEIIDQLGPEPIDDDFTLRQFRAILAGRSAPIKATLLDQRLIAGLGNIYVDEALFEARVRPDTPAGDVSPAAAKRLFAACRAVLERGIANRGASFRSYVDGEGRPGSQHMFVQVFRRTGQPCYVCGTPIERTVVAQRGTHFCPHCQRRTPARRPRHVD